MANRYNRKPNQVQNTRRFFERDNFDRPRFNVNPWQGGMMPNSGNIGGPSGGATEATLALANNLINNILQSRPSPMPSLLDLNVRRDFGPNYMREERFGSKIVRNMQMGGQMNRRVLSGGRNDRTMNKVRRPLRPNTNIKAKSNQKTVQDKKEPSESKAETGTESEVMDTDNIKKESADPDQSTTDADGAEVKSEKPDTPKKNEGIKTDFDGIASEFLECHICEKKMWDGRSFDNHIKGRVHNIMMDKTKQSYHMTADAMRQELKINEMKRSKRGFITGAKRVFCAMCDLFVFYAAAHRRSPGHQKLKKYLHPSCNTCHKEFPTRIELDEHRLTAPHLRLLQEKQKDIQSRPKPEVVTISTLQDELAQVRVMHDNKKKNQAKKDESGVEIKTEGEENGEKTDETDVKTDDGEKAEGEQVPPENVLLLLDYKEGDDLTDMTRENLPRYQTDRPVGASHVTEFSCKQCTLCKKFFDSDETATVHLRTWKHFQSYIKLIHSKGNFKVPQENSGVKRDLTIEGGEEEGDNKRRKTDNESDNVDEDELLNGMSAEGENGDHVEDEDQLLNASADVTEDNINVSMDAEIVPEQAVEQAVELEQVEKPRPNRGRGRGRGARGRRGRY